MALLRDLVMEPPHRLDPPPGAPPPAPGPGSGEEDRQREKSRKVTNELMLNVGV